MMTLNEAIRHAEEKACGNTECAEEYRQLAEWLKELNIYKEYLAEVGLMRVNLLIKLDKLRMKKKI